jgi:hypothetical protein
MTGRRIDLPHCDRISIALGQTQYRVPTAVVFDIMSIAGKNAFPLHGSLALDIFADNAITIEQTANRLIVESAASLAVRTRHAIEVLAPANP